MTILVTGVKGMIGSHLVEGLLAAGHAVIGVGLTCDETCEGNYCQQKVDLADKERLQNIVDSGNVDRIIHLAACFQQRQIHFLRIPHSHAYICPRKDPPPSRYEPAPQDG